MPTIKSATARRFMDNPRLFNDRRSSSHLAMKTETVIARKEINDARKENPPKSEPCTNTAKKPKTNSKIKNKMLCPNSRHPARNRLSPGEINTRIKIEGLEEVAMVILLP